MNQPAAIVSLPPVRVGEGMAALLLIAVVLAGLLFPALGADFHIIDDHEILTQLTTPTPLSAHLTRDMAFGRFRPLYITIRYLQIALLGANPVAWHVLYVLLGIAALMVFYLALRHLMPPLYALLALGLMLLFPYATAIWYRLGPQEAIGILLTALAAFGAVRAARFAPRWDMLFVAGVLLAGFYKESFTFLVPVLLLMRFALNRWFGRPARALDLPALVLGGVFIFQLALIGVVRFAVPESAGAAQATPEGYLWQPFAQLTVRLGGFVPVFLALALSWRRYRAWCILFAVGFALWITPQALLYTARLSERYWWPAIIAPCVSVAMAIWLLRDRWRWVGVAALLLTAPLILPNVPRNLDGASTFAAQTHALRRLVDDALNSGASLVVVRIKAEFQIEQAISIVAHLRFRGYQGRVYLDPLGTASPDQLRYYDGLWDQMRPDERPGAYELIYDFGRLG